MLCGECFRGFSPASVPRCAYRLPKKPMIRSSALVLVALVCATSQLGAQSTFRPLNVRDVEMLLEMTKPEIVEEMIWEDCVTFPLDAAASSRLRAAGADDSLLAAVRGACFKGTELVVESIPTGADLLLNGKKVGPTPWTGKWDRGGRMKVEVKAQGRTQNRSVNLQMGQRTRVRFAFAADTVRVPEVRTAPQVASALGLERQWTPLGGEPPRPGAPPSDEFLGLTAGMGLGLAGAWAGYRYCEDPERNCGLAPDEGGTFVGLVSGVVLGTGTIAVLDKIIHAFRTSAHENATERRQEWERSNAAARASWLHSHPEVLRVMAEEKAARAEVQDRNARTRARNSAQGQTRVTSERLPGSKSY